MHAPSGSSALGRAFHLAQNIGPQAVARVGIVMWFAPLDLPKRR